MNICGIDPGLNGGLAFINSGVLKLYPMPVIGGKDFDIQEIKRILETERPGFTVLENQIAMPGQGLTSTLQTGKGFGILLGLLAGMNFPYQVIGAKQWQTKLFTGVKGSLDTKDKSEVIAKRLFPTADFRKSDRARVAHDGLTDAACIAEYGRRIYSQGADPVSGMPHVSNPMNPDVCVVCGAYLPTADPNDCKKPLYETPDSTFKTSVGGL